MKAIYTLGAVAEAPPGLVYENEGWWAEPLCNFTEEMSEEMLAVFAAPFNKPCDGCNPNAGAWCVEVDTETGIAYTVHHECKRDEIIELAKEHRNEQQREYRNGRDRKRKRSSRAYRG